MTKVILVSLLTCFSFFLFLYLTGKILTKRDEKEMMRQPHLTPRCPVCGFIGEFFTVEHSSVPDDMAVCAYCRALLRYVGESEMVVVNNDAAEVMPPAMGIPLRYFGTDGTTKGEVGCRQCHHGKSD